MARILVLLVALGVGAAGLAAVFARSSEAAPAAAIQRTFVSTSGNDANACTRAEPCRNFAAALVNTLAGGEVVALDSGGYGPFVIDKAVSVIGAPGVHAAVTTFAGEGITINAGASDIVVLRNLYVTGLGGAIGIRHNTGAALYVESVTASGFTSRGLRVQVAPGATTKLVVRDSVFRQNDTGLLVVATGGAIRAQVDGTRADGNATKGFWFTGPVTGSVHRSAATGNGTAGFYFQDQPVMVLSDSTADGNNIGGVDVEGTGSSANVTLNRVVLSNNGGFGVFLSNNTFVRIGGSSVTGSNIGLWNTAGGTLETLQDNTVRGNPTDVAGPLAPAGKT